MLRGRCVTRLLKKLQNTDGEVLYHEKMETDPGIVFEKIVIDCGGYQSQYLFGNESPVKRN